MIGDNFEVVRRKKEEDYTPFLYNEEFDPYAIVVLSQL